MFITAKNKVLWHHIIETDKNIYVKKKTQKKQKKTIFSY